MTVPGWAGMYLRPGERVLWWGRPSFLGLLPIGATGIGGILAVVLGVGVAFFEARSAGLGLAAVGFFAFTAAMQNIVPRVVGILFTVYVVTDQRFYAVTSFLNTKVESVPLSRISLVSLKQGPLEGLLGLWTARVTSYDRAGVNLLIPAMRDGEGLLTHTSEGLRRGANASWLLRSD